MNSPCFGCDKRVVGCHSNCFDYISYRKKLEALRKQEKDARISYRPKHNKKTQNKIEGIK